MSSGPRATKGRAALQAILDALRRSDFPAACHLADEAAERFAHSPQLRAVQAHLLLWRGRLEEARAAVAHARALVPECAFCWAAEADVAAFEGRFEEAKQAAERALALDGSDAWVLMRCVSAYSAAVETDAALAAVARWREQYPDDDLALAAHVTLLVQAGQEAPAEELLREAEARFPESPPIWRQRARLLLRAHRFEQAADLLRRAAAAAPGSFEVWADLAMALSLAGRLDEAEAAARRSLEISACSARAMHALARVCQARGEETAAAEWERRAAAAIPALGARARIASAVAAMRHGRWEEALAAVAEAPCPPGLETRRTSLRIKVRALLELGRPGEAAAALAELEQQGDSTPESFELRGQLREAQADWLGAVAVLRAGIARYPAAGVLRARLLRLLHARGAADEEAALIAETFDNLPDTVAGICALIMALDDAGHKVEARRMRRLGRQHFPHSQELLLFEAIDKLERGDLAGARDAARQLTGEWRRAAGQIDRAALLMEKVRRQMVWLSQRRPGSDPPKMN